MGRIELAGSGAMSDAWMDEFTYQIVIRKDLLLKSNSTLSTNEPIVLAPWDPDGIVGLIFVKIDKSSTIVVIVSTGLTVSVSLGQFQNRG